MVELMYRMKAFLNVLDTSSIRFCKTSLIGSFPLRNRKAIVSLPFTITSYNGSLNNGIQVTSNHPMRFER